MRFVDTNVLIYSVSSAPEDSTKQRIAVDLLAAEDLALSVQVLQEFYAQATRANRPNSLSHAQAVAFIQGIRRFPVQPITLEVFLTALEICQRFQLSYWDSAILAAARISGCDTVLSEDLSPDQDYGGLRVVNPFSPSSRRS